MRAVVLILVCVCVAVEAHRTTSEKDNKNVKREGVTARVAERVVSVFRNYSVGFSKGRFTTSASVGDVLSNFECSFCVDFITNIREALKTKYRPLDYTIIEDISVLVCLHGGIHGDDMGEPVDYDVCYGAVHEFTASVAYIVFQTKLSPDSICSFFGACPPRPPYAWNVTFSDTPKPPSPPPPTVTPNAPKYRILQISDIHYDPLYTPGNSADCAEPVCCRSTDDVGNGTSAAGYWGDYRNCDTPLWSYESLLQYAASLFADDGGIDFVLYTGDTPVHAVWETTPQGNIDMLNTTYQLVRQYLPNAKFFGSLGNHEPSPVDLDPPPGTNTGTTSIQWLYDGAAAIWGEFLDDAALSTLQYAGYYSMRIDPSLIVIAWNMNFGDSGNWWLLINPVDPANMLQWLSDQLQAAEDNGDKVIIFGHQKSAGLLHSFSYVYFDLLLRYESTVVGQFFGHSHSEYFVSMLDPSNISRGFGALLVCGSVTPYSYLNMGFKIHEIDVTTKGILNHYTYVFNMTEANLSPNQPPRWYMEYSAREAYGFTGDTITPQDWADLTVRMETDDVVWDEYSTYLTKSAPSSPCEGDCRTNSICNLRVGRTDDYSTFCPPTTVPKMRRWKMNQKKDC